MIFLKDICTIWKWDIVTTLVTELRNLPWLGLFRVGWEGLAYHMRIGHFTDHAKRLPSRL